MLSLIILCSSYQTFKVWFKGKMLYLERNYPMHKDIYPMYDKDKVKQIRSLERNPLVYIHESFHTLPSKSRDSIMYEVIKRIPIFIEIK